MEQEILKDLSTNIIKWYEFKENSQILYIGENDEIKKNLSKKYNVEWIINLKEMKISKKFDYIIIDIQEIQDTDIELIKQNIDENGKIIFLLDNKFGISNFITYNYNEQISPLEEQKQYANISQICSKLKEERFYINKYMVYPNRNKVDIIINSNYEQISDKIEKYFCDYSEEKVVLCNEIQLLKKIKEFDIELLKKIANSYFIEASLTEINSTIKYVSFNNYRNDKYRLITKIKQDIVIKQEENENARQHIKEIVKNLSKLQKYNFKFLDKFEDNTLYSDFIPNRSTLDVELANNVNNTEFIIDILLRIKDELLKHSIKYTEIPESSICKVESMKDLNFLEYAFYDMVPKNCFYINEEFYFFDQEWMEKYLPVEFIMYRAVINSYDLVRKMNIDNLFEKLNIMKYKNIFEELDAKIREKVTDKKRLDICQKKYNQMYEIIYENKSNQILLQNYKENDSRQNEYIKMLENKVENLKNNLE